ncbi:golgin IMH1 [Trifolium pratense]|uniref:golgin IMH1 n=1 Tax=Trifolium pratense TaxID=57577 RepID=UPI001E693AB5|nr:golgin IMH1 [Trifolium pratense]
MTENPRAGAGNRRTRSQAAPEWAVTESLILVNEIAAVEADCSVEFSSYQQWDIISGNCAALEVDRNLAQCRRKWRSLLAEYDDVRKGRKSSNLDPELFDAIGRVVKGREERGEIDRESDAEIGDEDLDATVEIETGSKRKRQRSKPKRYREEKPKESHEEQPENTHLEDQYLKDLLGKKSKLNSPAKRRAKHIETPSTSLAEVDKNHDTEEKPKPTSVGNITNNNSREENEEMLKSKLKSPAKRRAKYIETPPTSLAEIDENHDIEEMPRPTSVGNITNNNIRAENEEMLKSKLKSPAKKRAKHIETPRTSLAEVDENHDIEEKPKPTSVGNITNNNIREENEEMLKSKLKAPAKRRAKHIETLRTSLAEVDKNHDIEEKPTSVGNIPNNNIREENEEMLTLKLQELAIEIQDINAESADCKEANSENIEDYRTEFTRRQGDKLIARLGNFSNTLKQLCDLLQECK